MTEFPILATKHTLDHSGGTKSFHLYVLHHKGSGRSLFITRWGKTGSFGQVKVEQHSTHVSATRAFDKKLEEKEKGGYRGVPLSNGKDCDDQPTLTNYLGMQLTGTIAPSDWAWLKTGDATSLKEKMLNEKDRLAAEAREDRLREQAAKAERDAKAKRELEEKLRLEQEAERAQAQEQIPNWGRF
jgi:predicted DNA-binding WGR domain protein